jgi:hypothetical protein
MQGLQNNWGGAAMRSGVGMLGLGTVLLALGAIQSAHGANAWMMATASVLVSVGMLLPLGWMGVTSRMPATRMSLAGILLAAGVFFLAYRSFPATVWIMLPSGGLGVSNPGTVWITLPAAGMGILWSLWLLRLALSVQHEKGKARLLVLASGWTATLGILLAVQSDLSRFTAITAAACFALWIGVQILMSIPLLYREMCAAPTAAAIARN